METLLQVATFLSFVENNSTQRTPRRRTGHCCLPSWPQDCVALLPRSFEKRAMPSLMRTVDYICCGLQAVLFNNGMLHCTGTNSHLPLTKICMIVHISILMSCVFSCASVFTMLCAQCVSKPLSPFPVRPHMCAKAFVCISDLCDLALMNRHVVLP